MSRKDLTYIYPHTDRGNAIVQHFPTEGNVLEVCKILNEICYKDSCSFIKLRKYLTIRQSDRDMCKKMFPHQANTSLIRKVFIIRTVNMWKRLPEDVVNTIKNRLDKAWSNEELVSKYKTTVSGSELVTDTDTQ